jgi:predicted RNase H-like nuclease
VISFIGVDLGWYGKPSGVALIQPEGPALRLAWTVRFDTSEQILASIASLATDTAVVAVDAPLVIENITGQRPVEAALNRDFARFHAGCYPANLSLPFAGYVRNFSAALVQAGFRHGASTPARSAGRFQIEIHPHAASITLFELDRIIPYKRRKGRSRASCGAELSRLRECMLTCFPLLDPPLLLDLPPVPDKGDLKPTEDRIDAVLCAYIAVYWWFWGRKRNRVYGTEAEGYIVVPDPRLGIE